MSSFQADALKNLLDQVASRYHQAAFLPHEIAERLLAQLDEIPFQPKTIVDLGCRTGYSTQLLQQRFPDAHIYAAEISKCMLQNIHIEQVEKKLLADYSALPFAAQSVDLIYANLSLSWCNDFIVNFREIRRILHPDGLFLFSLFGVDTLREVRESWGAVDEAVHVHAFSDMHDIGDILLQENFVEPVMETEHMVLLYSTPEKLCRELRAIACHNIHQDRHAFLTGKKRWQKFITHYEKYRQLHGLPASFEIIYGHAFGAKQYHDNDAISIPISALKRKK